MAQFNLLPDVKLEYIKTRRLKRTVGVFSFLIAGGLLVVFVMLFLYVRVAQKNHIEALDKDIDTAVATLQEQPDLDKILTIQNQLNSLPQLHEQEVVSSRLVDYMSKMTPARATISNLEVDFDANTMLISGNANALSTVNKFIDTMKFTKYKTNTEGAEETEAFKNVILQNFTVTTSKEEIADESPVTYEIGLEFDPQIFSYVKDKADSSKPDIILNIPNIISTRSETETPTDLFVPQPDDNNPQVPGGQ